MESAIDLEDDAVKIKTRMSILFFSSILLSAFIFLLSIYYILHSGFFSGINTTDMHKAASEAAVQIYRTNPEMVEEELLHQLDALNDTYEKMRFAVLMGEKWICGSNLPELNSERELLEAVQKDLPEYRIVAEPMEETGHYVICYVNKADYEAMTYSFNMPRASGILGKISLIGAAITLVITGVFLYFFTRKEMKRFEKMQEFLTAFALEHTETRIDDRGNDELSAMAANINTMAEKIELQYQEKLRYDQSRQELVANLSHDLRTPLSSIIGYSEMLRDEIYESKEEEKQYIDIIHRKAQYMEYLLTELLEYSRLQLGKLVLDKTYMNLAELIREILIEYYPVIEKNGYELEIELPEDGAYGNWDKNRIGRVLRNLIDNALKYGMEGKKLRISLKQVKQEVVLEIQDYGVGMPEKEAEHIFEMFYRADAARNSKRGGMGLGLYISREIIRLHSGKISVISAYQQGTTVRIELPQEAV